MTAADLPSLRRKLTGRQRVWLVYSHNWYTDPDHLIPREITQHMQLTHELRFNGLRIMEFER